MLQAGLTFKPNANASILGFGHEYILPLDLTSLPVDEPGLVQATILNAIANLNNGEDVLLTPATKTSLESWNLLQVGSTKEMRELHATIEKALSGGATVLQLTEVIKSNFKTKTEG